MKKIVYVLSLLFMITACNGDNTTFENNAYKLRNAKNGAEITLVLTARTSAFSAVRQLTAISELIKPRATG